MHVDPLREDVLHNLIPFQAIHCYRYARMQQGMQSCYATLKSSPGFEHAHAITTSHPNAQLPARLST